MNNNPYAFTDPTGMERVRLGQHTDKQVDERKKEIEKEKKAINKDKTLTEQQKITEKAKLDAEKNTLSLEKQGNKAVTGYLAALDQIGERQGLQLSDFTLSTNSATDFASDPNIQGDPGAGGAMFQPEGYSEIFVNTQSFDYQVSIGTQTRTDGDGKVVSLSDINMYMGTGAVHERSHRDSPTRATRDSEGRAYTEQLRVLQKFGPGAFQSKSFFYFAAGHVMNGSERP